MKCVFVCIRYHTESTDDDCPIMIVKMEPDDVLTFRVQYLADTDPFNSVTMFPIPSRAPTYAFASSTPLATQLGAILRLLGAPQRVRAKSYTHLNMVMGW